MLDDKLRCPKCQTDFYFNEVQNVVHHREEKMPIRCPNCHYTVKERLSHGYFVSYVDSQTNHNNKVIKKEERPEKYKNIKTGAIISAQTYQKMIEEQEWLLNNPLNAQWLGVTSMFVANEEANSIDSYQNYIPYDEN